MSIIDTAKTVFELVKKGSTIDLQENLVRLREQAVELQEENVTLRTRISDLERQVALRRDIQFDGELYWIVTAPDKREGPFCQKCYDSEGKLIRLLDGTKRNIGTEWVCSQCKMSYGAYKESGGSAGSGCY
jgi:hypothetical protein